MILQLKRKVQTYMWSLHCFVGMCTMGPLCGFLWDHNTPRAQAGESLSTAISLLFNLSSRLERAALHIPLM